MMALTMQCLEDKNGYVFYHDQLTNFALALAYFKHLKHCKLAFCTKQFLQKCKKIAKIICHFVIKHDIESRTYLFTIVEMQTETGARKDWTLWCSRCMGKSPRRRTCTRVSILIPCYFQVSHSSLALLERAQSASRHCSYQQQKFTLSIVTVTRCELHSF